MITQSEKYQALLKEELEGFNIELGQNQLEVLIEYMRLILQINKQINLTRITDPKEFIDKHLIDSLTILPFIKKENQNIIDVGTGGGFPGIPLAIAMPANKFVLMDSTAKKLKVVEQIAKELKINNITFLHARAEEATHYPAYRDHFDYAVSRAVAELRILAELCLPFVKVGGEFIAYKSEPYNQELAKAQDIIEVLGGKVTQTTEYRLPISSSSRILIEIVKKEGTPKGYPRKFSAIKNG